MILLILGLGLFMLVHLVPTQPDLRQGLIDRLGPGGYRAVFAILSILGLALIIVGYGKLQMVPGKNPLVWAPPGWTRPIASLLMLPAMVLLVAAYVPSKIRTVAKHPMLVAVKLWAAGHLLVNGDLAALLLFGSFLGYAVYDRVAIKRRVVAPPPSAAGMLNDIGVVVAGLALYAFMLTVGHARLIGVPLLPGWA